MTFADCGTDLPRLHSTGSHLIRASCDQPLALPNLWPWHILAGHLMTRGLLYILAYTLLVRGISLSVMLIVGGSFDSCTSHSRLKQKSLTQASIQCVARDCSVSHVVLISILSRVFRLHLDHCTTCTSTPFKLSSRTFSSGVIRVRFCPHFSRDRILTTTFLIRC